jgi:hypothetical protein
MSTNAYLVLGAIVNAQKINKPKIAKALGLKMGEVDDAINEIVLDVIKR